MTDGNIKNKVEDGGIKMSLFKKSELSSDYTTKQGKESLIKRHRKRSPIFKNCILAALVGGIICAAAQGLLILYQYLGADEDTSKVLVSISFITIGAFSTALGFFDGLARRAGAGTLVPITGFSNAVVSQAIDARSEGYVFGVGASIFSVAGPVILFGILAGSIYGVIYYLYPFVAPLFGF